MCLLPSQHGPCLRKVCPETASVNYQLKVCKKYRIPKTHFIVSCQKVAFVRVGSVTQAYNSLQKSCAKKELLMSLKTWKTSISPL